MVKQKHCVFKLLNTKRKTLRTVNTVQGDDGGLSGKLPMTPQMQVGVQVFECVCLCVFIFVFVFVFACLYVCVCMFVFVCFYFCVFVFCVTGGKDDKP